MEWYRPGVLEYWSVGKSDPFISIHYSISVLHHPRFLGCIKSSIGFVPGDSG
jgi:hypothetical protein